MYNFIANVPIFHLENVCRSIIHAHLHLAKFCVVDEILHRKFSIVLLLSTQLRPQY